MRKDVLDDLVTKEFLEQKYLQEGLTAKAIGELVGCYQPSILLRLRRFGIPVKTLSEVRSGTSRDNTPKNLSQDDLQKYYVNQGLSATEVGRVLGCSTALVCRSLRRYGFKVKNRRIHEGQDQWLWRPIGSELVGQYGYIYVKVGETKWVHKHRLLVEQALGRKLKKKEVVHHINEVRGDNRIENLMVFINNGAHVRFHRCPEKVWPEEIVFDGRTYSSRT